MKKTANNKGFTLIELVVAMVILGLIIALTTPLLITQYQNWVTQAAAEKTAGQLNDLNSASAQYAFTKGTQATGISGSATCLVEAGFLVSAPVPAQNGSAFAWDASGAPIVLATTTTTSIETCEKLNELYAGVAAGTVPSATATASLNMQCYGSGPYTIQSKMYQ